MSKKTGRTWAVGLAAALAVVCIRLCGVSLIEIPGDGGSPVFCNGDRVSVNKWAYGFRLLPMRWWGYVRWGARPMTRGEWAAFNDPTLGDGGSKPADERDVFVGFCYAAPGDSLWIDSVGNVSLRRPAGRQACRKLELPRRNVWQSVTSDNALWYAHTISLHEGKHASVVSGVLCVEGRPVKGYRFRHDYYWMSSANRHNPDDSRTFGFVPDTYLIGRLGHVIYSVDPIAPWYAPLRGGRMMMEVSRENLKP